MDQGGGGAAGLEAQISVVEQLSPFFWLSLLHLYIFFPPPTPHLLVMAFSSVVRARDHVVALTLIVFGHCFSAVQQKC